MRKFMRSVVSVCLFVLLFSCAASAAPKYKWQFSQPWPRPIADKGYMIFCDKVKEYTNGDIEIQFFANGILGDHDESFHGVRDGSIEITTLSPYVNLIPGGAVNWMPWTISTFAESRKAYKVNEGILFKVMDVAWSDVNCKLLFTCSQGPYGIANSKRDIKMPEDLKGLKLRVSSSMAFVRALENMGKGTGMILETLPWSEIYNALSRGVFDGCWDMWVSLIDERHCEVMKHFLDLGFGWDSNNIIINKELWDSLEPEYQEAVMKAAQFAQDAMDDLYENAQNEYIKKLEAMPDFKITYLTPEERAVWRERANMAEGWKEFCDPWLEKHWPGQKMSEKIRAELDRIRIECEAEAAAKASK